MSEEMDGELTWAGEPLSAGAELDRGDGLRVSR